MEATDITKYQGEFSQNKFWNKVKAHAGKMGRGLVSKALELYYLMLSSEVPIAAKAQIAGALGYLILPIDLIPDAIPVAGFTDDLAAIAFVLKNVSSYITPSIREQAKKKCDELFGEE